jgi:hypothetical protein
MARNPIVPEFLRTRKVNRFWFCSNDPCSCTCYPSVLVLLVFFICGFATRSSRGHLHGRA